ncbi:MAG: hypothetical protein CSA75_04970 [Sorangium cellulosum]|nr:MAG: hypothetical protein CSA75_04970 [Sorangium cellulosum]
MRWERVEVPLVTLPLRAVACYRDQIMAAGDGAVRIRWEGDTRLRSYLALKGCEAVELIGIGLADERAQHIVMASRQRLMMSTDGGQTVNRSANVDVNAPSAGLRHVELGPCGAKFAYADTTNGKLLVSADRGCAWRSMSGIGSVRGFALDQDGTAHVLSSREGQLQWLRSDDTGQWDTRLLNDAFQLPEGAEICVAVRGDTWVVATFDGLLYISTNAGKQWRSLRVPPQLRSVAVIPEVDRNVVVGALYLESEDRSYLFTVDPDRQVLLVADLSPAVPVDPIEGDPSEGIGCVHHVVWDDNRSCAWIAGAAGLAAWQPKLPT